MIAYQEKIEDLLNDCNEFVHLPVLPREIKHFFDFGSESVRMIDGTLGNGGHSAILLKNNPQMELLGIDRDMNALERASRNLAFARDRIRLRHGVFSDLAAIAADEDFVPVDGILLDIGISSPQIDNPERGFSWRHDGPLDMRMDQSSALSAADILNSFSESELSRIFWEYGELRSSRRLAARVVEFRKHERFETTAQLADFADAVLGKARPGKLPSPTLVFQALRIAVNDELGELTRALESAVGILKSKGRLGIISFHSLEDRIVKNFFRDAGKSCICPPGFPVCTCNITPTLKTLTNKVVTAADDELEFNRRACCAKLRVAEKI